MEAVLEKCRSCGYEFSEARVCPQCQSSICPKCGVCACVWQYLFSPKWSCENA